MSKKETQGPEGAASPLRSNDLLSGEIIESERGHSGRVCECGAVAKIQQIHTGKQWQYAYEWRIVCRCGLKTVRSTAVSDVARLWDSNHELAR